MPANVNRRRGRPRRLAGVRSPRVALVVRGERPGLVERLARALPDAASHGPRRRRRAWTPSTWRSTAGRPVGPRPRRGRRQGRGPAVAGAAPPRTPRRQPGRPGPGRRPPAGGVGGRGAGARGGGRRGADAGPRPARQPRARPGRPGRLGGRPARRATAGCARRAPSTPWPRCPSRTATRSSRARPAAGRTLTTVPGLRFASRCVLRSSAPVDLPSEYDAPAVSAARVRRRDVPGSPGGVRRRVRAAGELPAPLQAAAAQRGLRGVGAAVRAPARARHGGARRPGVPRSTPTCRGHFGHALTDQLGHLWGWRAALDRHPDLRALRLRQAGRGPGRLGAGAPRRRRRRPRPGRGGPRADSRRGAGRVLADVRDACLRAPRDRHDVRRGRAPALADASQPPAARVRCGCSAHGGRASAPATTPPRWRGCSRRTGSRSSSRRTTRCRSRRGWCARPTSSPASRAAGCSRSRSRAGPSRCSWSSSESYTASNEYLISSVARAPARPGAVPSRRAQGRAAALLQRVLPVRLHLRRRPRGPLPARGAGRPVRRAGNNRRQASVARRRDPRHRRGRAIERSDGRPASRARPDPALGDAGDRAGRDRRHDPGHGGAVGRQRPRRLLAVPVAVLDLPAGAGGVGAAVRQVRRPRRSQADDAAGHRDLPGGLGPVRPGLEHGLADRLPRPPGPGRREPCCRWARRSSATSTPSPSARR